METWRIREVAELEAVIKAMQKALMSHDDRATVLALHGDLGAGKTTFTQTLAATLGVAEAVTSPTFVIMKGYELSGQPFDQLIHIDAYRVEQSDELCVLGFAELLQRPRTLVVIEWAEKVADLLPDSTIDLTFAINNEERTITCNYG